MNTLGIDVGSSSVKVSLLDVVAGICLDSVAMPSEEMPIDALRSGWAEQDPDMWWSYVCQAITELSKRHDLSHVAAIGITYQMHGLVCVDRDGLPLRKSIIWCDSRAVEIGAEALDALGATSCMERTLNSPGNFTLSKLAWVKRNEPELFSKIAYFMLPGDYIAYKLSSVVSTTTSGLSEQILWNFRDNNRADFMAHHFEISTDLIPQDMPSIGVQCHTSSQTEQLLGIKQGTPISYRAGDQPNNAFSLNVMEKGEIAATGGTSGVVYGVTDMPKADLKSRVNTFLHVNHTAQKPSYGVLLCINGTGILNAWSRRNLASDMSYEQINQMCLQVDAGSDGVVVLPFGNGAERMLENCFTGAVFAGIDLNRHTKAHVLRGVQESIAFAFRYGIDIMKEIGLEPKVIRAGKANLFLSPLFRTTLATICDATIELYDTDGALGAARGAALGAGLYRDRAEAFRNLKKLDTIHPDATIKAALLESYAKWRKTLEIELKNCF